MSDEAGGAILDARRPVHHFVSSEAHFSGLSFRKPDRGREGAEETGEEVLRFLLGELGEARSLDFAGLNPSARESGCISV